MRLAVLGLGFMGSAHIQALRAAAGVELGAVCTRDARRFSGQVPGVRGNLGGAAEPFDFSGVARYTRIEDALSDSSLDAVDICLPTRLHAPAAMAALRAGKHVLVEKPMALDAAAARAMTAEAENRDRILMTAHVLRFSRPYQSLSAALRAGQLGALRSALFRRRCAAPAWSAWLSDPAQSGGGVFDLLIHDADMCLHLFGKPCAVSATGYAALDRGIDLITATLFYPDGCAAVITGGWHNAAAYPFTAEYTVVTDGGTLDYNSRSAPSEPGEQDGYAAEIEYFAACCRAGKPPDLCPPQESADAVALMRLLIEARGRNGERIACAL